jgi:cytochrome P450
LTRRAPEPPGNWLLGHLLPLRRNTLGYLCEAQRRCGDVVRLRLGPIALHLVSHPELIAQVLHTRAQRYDRATRSAKLLADITGESLLNTNGAAWARRRRLAGPSFHPQRVLGLLPAMGRATARAVETWRDAAREQGVVDADASMMGLTLAMVAEALFSVDLERAAPQLQRSLTDVLEHTWRRVESPLDLPQRFPTRSRRRFREGLAVLDGLVRGILDQRHAGERKGDLLDALMAAKDGDGAPDDALLRNETLTFLLAGHETTAHALAWALHLLSRHPEAAAKLRQEARDVLGDRDPAAEDLPKLRFTLACFQESLRLFPTIWILERRAVEADEIAGFRIPKGSSVLISPYVVHRHAGFWEDAEAFSPERFLDAAPKPAYLPFGLGPHACIGEGFAHQEALVILPLLLRAFDLEPAGPAPVPQAGITLRPRDGVLLRPRLLDPALG